MNTSRRAELPVVPHYRDFYVVGIGASAGGLGALRTLFSNMPAKPGFACVVVMHLSPEHESHLVELLQPYTRMPVQQVTETVALERDHIYVIPPNANLNSIDTHLRLSELEERRVERAPIDHFLRTLAATHDGTAVGVVLTGAGSDGALGLRQIKEHGGLTVVQDPAEAEYDSMPRSAISTGLVDVVAPLRDIPRRVLGYCATKPRVPDAADGDSLSGGDAGLINQIVGELQKRTGHDGSVYRRSVLLRRIRHRMQVRQLDTLETYLEVLRNEPDEPRALVGALHHTVAEFFHQPDIFDHLEQRLIPELFARKQPYSDRIRAWSIGCSTGEVAYSLAMLMLEQASSHKSAPHLQVFATDSSDDMLQLARAGAYPEEVAASIPKARLERFFNDYPGHYRVKSEVRDIVVFAPHDVFKDPPFAHLDLIVCPSVLGDLQPEVRRGVLRLFHFALERDGALIVGPNDEIDEPGLFEADGRTTRVFRRSDGPRRPLVMPLSARAITAAANGEPAAATGVLWESSFVLAHRRALEKHIVPSVLVDAENRVVHYSPRAWQFLRIPGGELNHDILALVGTSLRAPLQRGLAEARRVDLPWVSPPLAIMTDHGPRRVLLRVEPAGRVDHTQLLLVMFDELAADANAAAADAADPDANAEEALKKELHSAASVDRLATALERTNLRLRAIVDAVTVPSIQESHSAERDNGKLRAILGELESNQEELRALNQDITAVDLARRQRIDELAQQSSDSYQLLQATGIATLFLDTELRVLRFTPRATEIFRVSEADVGRPLVELTHTLATTELIPDAERVLEHLTAVEREVRADGDRWYLLRMLPYRPVPAYVSGVAVTLVDITDRVRAEEVLRQADRRKDEFLALLAHELRNPLAPISSGVELLRIAAPDHEIIRKVIPMMRRQVRQLVRMVDDLLEASRISGGRLRLRKGPTLLSDVVRDAVSATTLLIDQAKQRLTVDVPDEPVLLDADAARLTQVLSNLLSNASRYTPSGGHITVDARREGTEAVIRVTDTGVGMSEDVMQNMFGMFYRGANARRAGDSGLGIGLAIAKELVEMHGGMLTASSAGPGRGSQFMVQLPVSTDATAIVPAKEADILPSHGLRVLIVDDNPDAAEALSLQVEAMGAHQVVTVLGGEDALSRGREFRPDVVLLDLGMPEMDGFEVARRIRQEAWGKHVTLVALTGWGQEEHRQRTKAAGFNRHLTKPADRADIESVLAQSEPQ